MIRYMYNVERINTIKCKKVRSNNYLRDRTLYERAKDNDNWWYVPCNKKNILHNINAESIASSSNDNIHYNPCRFPVSSTEIAYAFPVAYTSSYIIKKKKTSMVDYIVLYMLFVFLVPYWMNRMH